MLVYWLICNNKIIYIDYACLLAEMKSKQNKQIFQKAKMRIKQYTNRDLCTKASGRLNDLPEEMKNINKIKCLAKSIF